MLYKNIFVLCISLILVACGGGSGGSESTGTSGGSSESGNSGNSGDAGSSEDSGNSGSSSDDSTQTLFDNAKTVTLTNDAIREYRHYYDRDDSEHLFILNRSYVSYPGDSSSGPANNSVVALSTDNSTVLWEMTQSYLNGYFSDNALPCADDGASINVDYIKRYDTGIRALMSVYSAVNYGSYTEYERCADFWTQISDQGIIEGAQEVSIDGKTNADYISLLETPPYYYDGLFYTYENHNHRLIAFPDDDLAITSEELTERVGTSGSAYYHLYGPSSFAAVNGKLYLFAATNLGNSPTQMRRDIIIYDLETRTFSSYKFAPISWDGNFNGEFDDYVFKPLSDTLLGIMTVQDDYTIDLYVFDTETNEIVFSDTYSQPDGAGMLSYISNETVDLQLVDNDLFVRVAYSDGVNEFDDGIGEGNHFISTLSVYNISSSSKSVAVAVASDRYVLQDIDVSTTPITSFFANYLRYDEALYTETPDQALMDTDYNGASFVSFTSTNMDASTLADENDEAALALIDDRFTSTDDSGDGSSTSGGSCDESTAQPYGDIQLDSYCLAACDAIADPNTDDSAADYYCDILEGLTDSSACSYCK